MSEPFLAEVRIIAFNFAPRGWAFCDGQILPISQNQSLYSLLGTTYGGDGRTSFALPDLRGRVPIHVGSSNGSVHLLGQKSGEEAHTLSTAEMASHKHQVNAVNAPANEGEVEDKLPAISEIGNNTYNTTSSPPQVNMASGVVANAGGGQAHNNMQPFLTLNFAIALRGLFPSRN